MKKNVITTIAVLILGVTSRADAALIFSAPDISAALGSSGTFDVLLENTGPSSVSISAFSFSITTTNPGITFTDATNATTSAPYIFGSDSLFGPDITISSGTTLTASDSPFAAPFYDVASGATVGLGDVSYTIAPGASPGLFSIMFQASGTSLADQNSANITGLTLTDGQFDLTAVPEPSTVGFFGALALGTIIIRRKLNPASTRAR